MFIVAELSCNHKGHLNNAIALVDAAADAGADAIKLQTFIPARMAFKGNIIQDGSWKDFDLYELYERSVTPMEWHKPLFDYAKSKGLVAFSTPFDLQSLKFLESIDCPIYKISSFEIRDLELIEACAKTGKPLIISTGMASKREIVEAAWTACMADCSDLTFLKCTSAYPTPAEDCNLATMVEIGKLTKADIGISDHTQGIAVPVAATVLGASVIEKHLTLSRSDGLDADFSLEPHEFKQMVAECRNAAKAIGEVQYGPTPSEMSSYALRRSLFVSKDICAGEILTREHLIAARPNLGESPAKLKQLLGRTMKASVEAGTPFIEGMLVRAE